MLNRQVSSWANVTAAALQGSILSHLFFLIYVNDLLKDLNSNAKLFSRDTLLFSVIHDSNISIIELNDDFSAIKNWAFQWKMSFNPDPNKQAQEVIFSRKANSHYISKHLGVIIDSRLTFDDNLNSVLS